MYIVGMGLVRPLQPWDILLIYHNNQKKKVIKVITPLLTLVRGTLSFPIWYLCQKVSLPLSTLRKLCYTKALEWSSLVPGPEVKSSSLEIKNLTLFNISNHYVRFIHHTFITFNDMLLFYWDSIRERKQLSLINQLYSHRKSKLHIRHFHMKRTL